MLPDPIDQPTLDATEVASALGIGVTLTRQLGRRFIESGGAEGIPCSAYGRLLRFPTAAVRQHLGIDPPRATPTSCTTPAPKPGGSAHLGGPDGGTHARPVRIVPTSHAG